MSNISAQLCLDWAEGYAQWQLYGKRFISDDVIGRIALSLRNYVGHGSAVQFLQVLLYLFWIVSHSFVKYNCFCSFNTTR